MNYAISINSTSINIQKIETDNAFTIRGHGPDGYVNTTIMKDDPEVGQQVTGLIAELFNHQKAELDDYVATAPVKLEEQYSALQSHLDELFSEEE